MSTIMKCPNGHFYDMDRTKDCPYCKAQEEEKKNMKKLIPDHPYFAVDSGDAGEEKTVAMLPGQNEEIMFNGSGGRGKMSGMAAPDEGVTVGIFKPGKGTAFVTGWLVGIEGPVKGRDFRIIHGKNWIGRSYNMDLCISEGIGIADIKHCAVVYDGKGNHFFVVPGSGTVTYLNGNVLEGPSAIGLGDQLKLGNCKFEFVPFCREGRVWDPEELKEGFR